MQIRLLAKITDTRENEVIKKICMISANLYRFELKQVPMYVHVFPSCLLVLLVQTLPKIQKRLLTDLALPKIRRGLFPPRGRRFAHIHIQRRWLNGSLGALRHGCWRRIDPALSAVEYVPVDD